MPKLSHPNLGPGPVWSPCTLAMVSVYLGRRRLYRIIHAARARLTSGLDSGRGLFMAHHSLDDRMTNQVTHN